MKERFWVFPPSGRTFVESGQEGGEGESQRDFGGSRMAGEQLSGSCRGDGEVKEDL